MCVYIGITPWQCIRTGGSFLDQAIRRYSGDLDNPKCELLMALRGRHQLTRLAQAEVVLRQCEADTIFLIHGWNAAHYNLVDTRPRQPALAATTTSSSSSSSSSKPPPVG